MKLLQYKGFFGSFEISPEDDIFFGKVEFIDDLVSYEGSTPKELEAAFIEAVDDYVETCKELGRDPQKPYKGTFNVRCGANLHKQAAIKAKTLDINLNELVKRALESYVR